MNDDLKLIKKHYGEAMMHFCREYFSTILDNNPGTLSKLLLDNFESNKFLYNDLVENLLECDFKNYIYNLTSKKFEEKIIDVECPEELLDKAGYKLYECKTEGDIQQFKKYYAKGEELCTFRGGRLHNCYVYFAVKKNVMDIKREDFKTPKRQDEYGTSVISIQFTKDIFHTLSIKNRYNHKVQNPDATFSNNLDNIIEGLTDSFSKYYGMEQKSERDFFEMVGYVKANDGKYYKYNYEIDNVYYCVDNVIIDNFEVKRYNKEQYIIIDYFIIDLKNKTVKQYGSESGSIVPDDFVNYIGNNIKKIEVKRNQKMKDIIITYEDNLTSTITVNKCNQIIGLVSLNKETHIHNNFLYNNETILFLNMPNVKEIEGWFLSENTTLLDLKLKKVESIGMGFLYNNTGLISIDLPNLEYVRSEFIYSNEKIAYVNLPKLKRVSDNFLRNNKYLLTLELPNLKSTAGLFLSLNEIMTTLSLPELTVIGNGFLLENTSLVEVNMPKIKYIIGYFMINNPNKIDILKSLRNSSNNEEIERQLVNYKLKQI